MNYVCVTASIFHTPTGKILPRWQQLYVVCDCVVYAIVSCMLLYGVCDCIVYAIALSDSTPTMSETCHLHPSPLPHHPPPQPPIRLPAQPNLLLLCTPPPPPPWLERRPKCMTMPLEGEEGGYTIPPPPPLEELPPSSFLKLVGWLRTWGWLVLV